MAEPTVFVIDDDQSFLLALSALVKSMGLASQTFGSGEEFFSQFEPARAGCLVLELRLPGLSGLEIQERLAREPIAPPLIFVTAFADVAMVRRARRQGALDFLQKQSYSETELWESIQNAVERDRANRHAYEDRESLHAKVAQLNALDRQVLDLLLSGKSNERIADALELSRRAVESRRARLMRKLGVSTLPDLVRFSMDAGLYPSPHTPSED